MRHAEAFHTLPDVGSAQYPETRPPRWLRRLWTYGQGYRGIRVEDAYVVLFDGGVLGHSHRLPEGVWAIRCPLNVYEQPTYHYLFGCSLEEHESYRASIVRTPESWPDSHRWLAAYTGTHRTIPPPISASGRRLSQHVGIGWSPELLSGWLDEPLIVPPRNTSPAAPAGVWAVALLVLVDEVYLVVRDASVMLPLHEVYRFTPATAAPAGVAFERVGALDLPGMPWNTWLSDASVTTDVAQGYLRALESRPSEGDATAGAIVEWGAPLPANGRPAGELRLTRTGRTWRHPDPDRATWDAGYMRELGGRMASPGETVFASCGFTGGHPSGPRERGGWWGQYWTSLPAPILERTPEPLEVIE